MLKLKLLENTVHRMALLGTQIVKQKLKKVAYAKST
jgi:hypothetical protein